MDKISIIVEDGVCVIDGVARLISMAGVPANVHAIQWYYGVGHIEHNDGTNHTFINDLTILQPLIDRWVAAEPPEPTLDVLKEMKVYAFRMEAVKRIAQQVPDWDTLSTIKTVAGLWASHLATDATVPQRVAKDIYLYVRNIVPGRVAAVSDEAALDAIDVTAADPFGDGTTPWPQ